MFAIAYSGPGSWEDESFRLGGPKDRSQVRARRRPAFRSGAPLFELGIGFGQRHQPAALVGEDALKKVQAGLELASAKDVAHELHGRRIRRVRVACEEVA